MPPQRKRRPDEEGKLLTEKKLRVSDETFNNDTLLELFEVRRERERKRV